MKQWQKCPECGAVYDLTDVNIGGLRLAPLPVHVRGEFKDPSEFGSMLMAESLSDKDTCGSSELLAYVRREDGDDGAQA